MLQKTTVVTRRDTVRHKHIFNVALLLVVLLWQLTLLLTNGGAFPFFEPMREHSPFFKPMGDVPLFLSQSQGRIIFAAVATVIGFLRRISFFPLIFRKIVLS